MHHRSWRGDRVFAGLGVANEVAITKSRAVFDRTGRKVRGRVAAFQLAPKPAYSRRCSAIAPQRG
jgi:hypothetical protein